ncbi:hypothetical protein M1N23_03720 [Dehalococcoidia bacterium]|nr:hypothetical protein [Dehalococcoidia bacterium]
MTYSGRYGLVHPNAGAAYAAHALWFRFGDEPDFLAMLDDLYEQTIPLLDVIAPLLHPVSSIEDLSARWGEITLLAETQQNTEVLIEQIRLIEQRVHERGLRCAWATYSMVYTLGTAHSQRMFRRRDAETAQQHGVHVLSTDALEHVPRWSGKGPNARVSSGLINPNSGGYVGNLYTNDDGNLVEAKPAKGRPYLSFHGAGLKGFTVPDETHPEEVERLVRTWRKQREEIRGYFKSEGMVPPQESRGGPDLDTRVDWLFLRIKAPGLSWGQLASGINAGLHERREYLEGLTEEFPEDSEVIREDVRKIHRDYTPSAIQYHVNRLRELLLIDRDPELKEKFG